jgi:hypothetical protein
MSIGVWASGCSAGIRIAKCSPSAANNVYKIGYPAKLSFVTLVCQKHGPQAVAVLRHLRAIGCIEFGLGATTVLPDGIDDAETRELLNGLAADGIVKQERSEPPPSRDGDLGRMMSRLSATRMWYVFPAMESAVDEVLGWFR